MRAKPPRPGWRGRTGRCADLQIPARAAFAPPCGEGPVYAPPGTTRFTIIGKSQRCVCAGTKHNRPPKNEKHRGAIGPAVHLFPGSVENLGE
jgi:hypothetical protein